jgi:hypothetical protein
MGPLLTEGCEGSISAPRVSMAYCLSRHGLLLALALGLLAPTAGAQAPPRERIALHPCVITGGKKTNTSDLEALCVTAAVRESMNLVPSTEVRAFLEKERGSCAKAKNRNACLGRLAAATKASRVLYITLNPFTPKSTRITGLVVDETGKKLEERPLELPRIKDQPPSAVVRFAVSQLLDQLEVAKAPQQESLSVPLTPGSPPEPEPMALPSPSPSQEPAPAATPPPPAAPVTAVKQEAPRGSTWKTPAGISGMAVGGVGLIVSGILITSSNSKAKEFNDAFSSGLPDSTQTARLGQLREDVESQRTTATLVAGAGAALAVGGAVLWLMDGSSSSKGAPAQAGTTQILAGPGQVGVRILLP